MKRLPLAILIMAIIYIWLIPSDPLTIKILFKLIPMLLILIYAYLQNPFASSKNRWLILTGLFFCMQGDWLITWFIFGLSSFLVGHLFYVGGFLSKWRFSRVRLMMILPIAIYAIYMGSTIIHHLTDKGDTSLIWPVIFYITVISTMVWSAIMTANKWAIIGSVLFMISDSILSWNQFVSSISYSNILIMTTYYLAQFFIAKSILASTVDHTVRPANSLNKA
ncbi:lysoplasmalogenase [Bacillus sp. RG28]|uniref:Lysoplasmalogenase n=1 Tax=Gottfriedia endophytica TaxID=2820819 RepID=A0A940SGE2_9BACI|nr:lysoplasmalogenase [Gottfriedia endophytica]MBP0724967.1 lysoplasmalogenase [Gottfriedia endophytica]